MARGDAGGLLDCRATAVQVLANLRHAQTQLEAVPVTVQGDQVPLGGDPLGERRPPLHLLADEEEGGRGSVPGQNLEHRGGSLRVRPVVEGERDPRSLELAHQPNLRRRPSAHGGKRAEQGADHEAA